MLYDDELTSLPVDATDEDYETAKSAFSSYDPSYVFNGLAEERRVCLEAAFEKCQEFLDEDFRHQIKLPGNFISRIWELQLCTVLIENGYKLVPPPKGKKQQARPDFCIENADGSKTWVEAVCPQLGPLSPKPEMISGKIYSRNSKISDELNLSAPRVISSTIAKFKKRSSYENNPEFDEKDKFVIAINTELISHHEPSNMAKELVLYGMGLMYVTQSGKSGRYFHDEIAAVINNKEVIIPAALFHKTEYENISAVISSDSWFCFGDDYVSQMARRINTYFNHSARNPIELEEITFGTRHVMECVGSKCELKHFEQG